MKLRTYLFLSLIMALGSAQALPGWGWTNSTFTRLKDGVSAVVTTGLELTGIIDNRDAQLENQRKAMQIKSLEQLKSLHISLAVLLAQNQHKSVCREILNQIKAISDVSQLTQDANKALIALLEKSDSHHEEIGQAYSNLFTLINQQLPKKQEGKAASVLSEFLTDPDTYLSLVF